LGHFRRDPEVKKKADGTWVSEGDWAVEAQIRLRIARTFPDHNILGEEEGLTGSGGGEARAGAPTWIIDPIDGTNNFIAGIPIWATLVALQVDGRNVVGAVSAPALDELYDAAEGAGARMNGEEVRVSDVASLESASVASPGAREFSEHGLAGFYAKLTHRCWRSRGFGDFWGHMLVARGALDVMVEPILNVWDFAALEPIVSEAGGRITGLNGEAWRDQGSCVTTNGHLHDEVLGLATGSRPQG
jgi:histidinol-phosphatase